MSVGSYLPPIGLQKDELKRKSIGVLPLEHDNRRVSVVYPVTALNSRLKEKSRSLDSTNSQGLFRGTGSLVDVSSSGPKQLNAQKAWRVSLLVTKAKRKFSDSRSEQIGVGHNSIYRRISLGDFFHVATMKKSDTDKRRMIRDLKIKAMVHKVTFILPLNI